MSVDFFYLNYIFVSISRTVTYLISYLGQTWVMAMIRLIQQAKELEEGGDFSLKDFYQKIPFIEKESPSGEMGADQFSMLQSPRFMKTHLPFQLWKPQLEKHPNLRVIQTIRNPKDTLVSYYHHARSDGTMGAFNGTWDQFFERFKEKKLPWGDYFEHIAEWYKFNKDRENSLVLRYEEMKEDHRGHVIKIAKFIGEDPSDKAIDIIVEKSTVKEMSKKYQPLLQNSSWKIERSNFIRKGEVGDWVNYFSKEQSDYIDAKCKEYLEPLGITFAYNV